MGYCTEVDIKFIIAQSLTTGTSATPASGDPGWLINIGREFKKNLITTETLDQYINWAADQIDGILGSMYITPFCQQSDFETHLNADISTYNLYLIVDATCPLSVGDRVVLIDGDITEEHIIASSLGNGVFETEDEILYEFPADTRVVRIKYPSPITLIATRLAAANIYEKYFAAQTSPEKSGFGDNLKKLARAELNNILNGRTVLRGATMIGHRFVNSTLKSRYNIPGHPTNDSNIEEV